MRQLFIAALVTTGLIAIGCGSNSASTQDGGATQAASDCASRCSALADRCASPSDMCSSICGTVSEGQLTCMEAAGCNSAAQDKCLESTQTPTPDAGPSATDSGTSKPPVDAGTDTKPSEVTITGKFGSVKALHIMSADKKKIASSISFAPKPTFTPSLTVDIPVVSKAASVTFDAPKGTCAFKPQLMLNSTQVSFMMAAEDVLPETGCTTFLDDIASNGVTLTLKDVPYPGNGVAKTVVIKLTP